MKKINHKLRRFYRQNRILLLGFLTCMAAFVLMIYFSLLSYSHYRQELIATEQKQLLTMAETIGKSLVNYLEQELNSIDLCFSALESDSTATDIRCIQDTADTFLEQKKELYDAAVCYDSDGTPIFREGDLTFCPPVSSPQAMIRGKKLCKDGWYQLYIARTFTFDGSPYTVVFAMNLNQIYQTIVAPVKIGRGGYSIVKDSRLQIIMHHAASQIGIDAVYDRSIRYPQLDLSDLFAWIRLQQTQYEGCGVVNSYVWDDPDLTPQKRIVAYTTITLPGEQWIVNSTIPFQELNEPPDRMILRLSGMCLLFFLILSVQVYIMTKSMIQAEGQKKEISYLKEINEGMELLRHKDEEIQHYQRMQSLGQMSSHIAHEFNNYLTPAMVYGEILENDPDISADNRELIHGILNSINQAAGLSRRLLDFSRQDAVSAAMTGRNLTEDVTEALQMITKLVPDDILLQQDITEEPLFVRGRKGMAEHILMNLSNNAFHAMERNTAENGIRGTLTIRLKKVSKDALAQTSASGPFHQAEKLEGDMLALLSVSDTGCGISQDAIDKIFEPFYTTKRSGKGTGLGLSVVQNVMKTAGGTITVESSPGQGTSFSMYFPLTDARTDTVSHGSSDEIRRLVIVDDDPALLKSLEAMLKHAPFKVECCDHPAMVLSKLQKNHNYCDVLLTDYSMPYMNGLELAEIVRKLNPSIRILLMSGSENTNFDWYLKNEFIDSFIIKSELPEKIKELFS